MRRDSPFGRPYDETIHVLGLDLRECIFRFFFGRVSSDPDPEWRSRSVDSRRIAALAQARGKLLSFALTIVGSYLD